MSNDEGTPKRRRGLFRRDRTEMPAGAAPRLTADGFDDPWSASAWDDWDDDFTAGNLRSSVPAAAAPRPEAVDAWLQSEADDFDTATRLNAKRWGGEANREPTSGLSALRQTNAAPPEPPPVAYTSVDLSPLVEPQAPLTAWASDPDILAADGSDATPEPFVVAPIADESPVETVVEATVEPMIEPDVPAEVFPSWEPVADIEALPVEVATELRVEQPAIVQELAMLETQVTPVLPKVEVIAPVTASHTSVSAFYDGDGDLDDTDDVDGVDGVDDTDELVAVDAIEPAAEHQDDLAALDAPPEKIPPPIASWAPVETVEVRFPVASPISASTLDDRREPVSPPAPAPRYVSVSVVDDQANEPADVTAPTEPVAAEFSAPLPIPPMEFAAPEVGPVAASNAAPFVEPVVSPSPAGRSRRWTNLAAEFGSDGDLEDSYPSRTRKAPPVAPPAPAERQPTVLVAPPVHPGPPPVLDSRTIIDTPVVTEPAAHEVAPDQTPPAAPRPTPRPTLRPTTPPATAVVDEAEVDPWSLPPVRAPRRPADVEPPKRTRITDDAPPAPRPAATRPTPSSRPTTPAVEPRSEARPARPATNKAPSAPAATARRVEAISVSPDISTFAGIIGSSLIGFGVLRMVLALVGDQPVIASTFIGTTARLMRLGQSFAGIGSAWPIALLAGTVVLIGPSLLGVQSHLRQWAPVLGIALVAAVAAVAAGGLQFYAGNKIGTPSTVRLLSDVIVGPIGFGVLSLVAIAVGLRAKRR